MEFQPLPQRRPRRNRRGRAMANMAAQAAAVGATTALMRTPVRRNNSNQLMARELQKVGMPVLANGFVAVGRNPNRTARNRRRRIRRRARIVPSRPLSVVGGPASPADLASGPVMQIANTYRNRDAGALLMPRMRIPVGSTQTGQLAAIKALHPAANIGPQRWPDKSADNTVTLQNTDAFVITKHANITGSWNLLIWLTPFIDCPIVYTQVAAGSEFSNPNTGMNADSSVTHPKDGKFVFYYSTQWGNMADKHPGGNYQTVRMTARSLTCDLLASATNDQGIVYAGQFTPNIALMPEVGGPAFRTLTRLLGRVLYKLEMNPDEMLKENEVEEKQVIDLTKVTMMLDSMSLASSTAGTSADVLDAPSGGQTGYRTVFQDWPYTSEQIVQVDPKGYVAKAKCGVYVPLRHASDILPYASAALESYLSATVPHVTDPQTSEQNVLLSQGWTMGAVAFMGLSADASVNLKVISALEAAPRADSELAKFTEEAPPLDKVAIDQARQAMSALPTAFPAEYNALGTIMEMIAKALGMSGIPVVSQVANAGLAINGALGGAGTRFLDSIF